MQVNFSNFNPFTGRVKEAKPANNLSNVRFVSPTFTSKADTFEGGVIKSAEFADNISKETQHAIKQVLVHYAAHTDSFEPIGTGADGLVYRTGTIRSFPEGLALKISHSSDKNPETGEMQRVNCDFSDEAEILKAATDENSNSQKYVGKMTLKDGRSVLISTFVEGERPEIGGKELNAKNLASVLGELERLDEIGILHRDLKKENVFINADDKAGLIDFGAAIAFDVKDVEKNDNENNFPAFEAPSNTRSFEDTLLMPYINDLMKQDPGAASELYREYLTLKSENIHAKRAEQIRGYLEENEASLDENQKANLNKLADYQELSAKVLKKPSKAIVDMELLKGQITYNSELAYKNEILLLNPLANVSLKMNALIAAKKLENMALNQLNRPNTPETREYVQYQLDYAKFRQQKIAGWMNGLVGWLTNCLSTDIQTAEDYKKPIIDQCVNGENLNEFEIPSIPVSEF